MSQWLKIRTQVKCLDSFKKACEEHDIKYTELNGERNSRSGGLPAVAKLEDEKAGGNSWYSKDAMLCKQSGHYIVMGDTDPDYSSIANRLGANFGKLMQSYTKNELTKNAQLAGGFVTGVTSKRDGTMVMRIATS